MNATSEIEGYFYFNQLYFPVNVTVVTLCILHTDCKKQIYLQAAYIIAKKCKLSAAFQNTQLYI